MSYERDSRRTYRRHDSRDLDGTKDSFDGYYSDLGGGGGYADRGGFGDRGGGGGYRGVRYRGDFQQQIVGQGSGVVKFFNAQKGFGFIVRNDGEEDVFVHISTIEQAGLTGLAEGQELEFTLIDRGGKISASDLALTGKALPVAARSGGDRPDRGPMRQLTGDRASGTVKFFNAMKGFGFIQRDDGQPDAFVHISAVERAGMASLNVGDRIDFELEVDRRGKYAAVNLVDAEAPSVPHSASDERSSTRLSRGRSASSEAQMDALAEPAAPAPKPIAAPKPVAAPETIASNFDGSETSDRDLELADEILDLYDRVGPSDEFRAAVMKLARSHARGFELCVSVAVHYFEADGWQRSFDYCKILHSIALEVNEQEWIGLIMLIQAKFASSMGDDMLRNLYALEAAASYLEAEQLSKFQAAIELVPA